MLVMRFQDMAYAQAYAMLGDAHLAEDVAQEAFIDAYVSLPRLREATAFPAWLRKIILKHVDRMVRGKKITLVPLDTAPDVAVTGLDPSRIVEERETNGAVRQAIVTLSDHERSVIVLHYLQDVAYSDVAAFLDVPLSTVKKRLHDARKRLKQRMIDMAEIPVQPPSHDDRFTNRVHFLLALRAGDLQHVTTALDHDPSLVDVREAWDEHEALYYDAMTRGFTPLHRAAWQGHTALMRLLLHRGADVQATTQGGMTPLHIAAQMGHRQSVQVLLGCGADPNAQMKNGLTPLHCAAMRGHRSAAETLLAHGARTDIAGKGGRTPLDWATLKGYDPIVELIRAREANG